jgi:hypothetical protein
VITAGGEDDVGVGAQVGELLLLSAGVEMDRTVDPHRDQRSDVWAAVGPDRGDPEQFRGLQDPLGLLPFDGNRLGTSAPGDADTCR